MTQRNDHAAAFHALHHDGLLILPNAWDAGSARLVESLGARAIATTSAGVAWSHGYADGNNLPIELLTITVKTIVRAVSIPVSVDFEAGYSDDPAAVERNIAPILDAGGVGINIEDGHGDPSLLCAKIEAVKRAASRSGTSLFVNARTDVYLRELVGAELALEETLARAKRYQDAGADGLFVPWVYDDNTIRQLATGTPLPLNVLARTDLPAADKLRSLGVRRLSAGSALARRSFDNTGALATRFLKTGESEGMVDGPLTHAVINTLGWPPP